MNFEEKKHKDLREAIDELRERRNRGAHQHRKQSLSEGLSQIPDFEFTLEGAEAKAQAGKLKAHISGFEFTSVGSVDAAMHTTGPFNSGPVLGLLSESTPHDLVALKQQSLVPDKLGYQKPENMTEDEFSKTLAAYASAELLDRERQLEQAEKAEDRTTTRWQIAWNVLGPLLGIAFGALLAWLGIK